MPDAPSLKTTRLLLRPFQLSDAPAVQRLAGAKEVAAGTFLPHPYQNGMAEQWIADQTRAHEGGTAVSFAITLAGDATFIGSISLDIVQTHRHARLGYWLGFPYWNQGYGTEAVRAVLHYGFMQREHYVRFDRLVDLELYGMLQRDFMERT